MLILCKIFKIDINELLAGERNVETINVLLNLYTKTTKFKKGVFKLSLFCIATILCLIIYYFINTYNSIKVYTIESTLNDINIYDGILIKTKDKIYFKLGKIDNYATKSQSLELFSIDRDNTKKSIYVCEECEEISLTDFYGYNAYFEYDKLNYIIKNLYLDIKGEKTITLKLKLKEDFTNNFFSFKKRIPIGESKISNSKIQNKKYTEKISQIKNKFQKKNDGYIFNLKTNNNNTEIILIDDAIIMEIKTDTFTEYWNIHLINDIMTYKFLKKEDIFKEFVYDIKTNKCIMGDCQNYETFYNKLWNKIDRILQWA